MKKSKILLVWDRIGDYHRARWQALQDIAGTENVFGADLAAGDSLYKWENTSGENQQYILLSKKTVDKFDFFNRIKNFAATLKNKNIDTVCIAGYGRIVYLCMIILAKFKGVKVILFAESWYGKNVIINFFKGFFLNLFCYGFIVSGKRAFYHFIHNLKIPSYKISEAYSVVDNKHFERKEIEFPEKPILLCVARFTQVKNLKMLAEAFLESSISKTYTLKIVGGGEDYLDLKHTAGSSKNIILSSWLPYSKLPELYHQATIFILPSIFEPWGLVVNEAMAAGLPIIISQQCGCKPDLAFDINSLTFDAENKTELVFTLNKAAMLNNAQLLKMGQNSRKIISNFTPKIWGENIIKLQTKKSK